MTRAATTIGKDCAAFGTDCVIRIDYHGIRMSYHPIQIDYYGIWIDYHVIRIDYYEVLMNYHVIRMDDCLIQFA